LEILGKRADGFHELDTVMVSVSLCDSLRFRATRDGRLDVRCRFSRSLADGSQRVPSGPQNLAWQALDRLRRTQSDGGDQLGGTLEIFKRIPDQSGLGGGSSDAATALRLARDAWRVSADDDQLHQIGASLGSDVPFFLTETAARCRGRGERIDRVTANGDLWFVIIKPPEGLSTTSVYARATLPQHPRSSADLIGGLESGDPRQVGESLHNGLQAVAMSMAPPLRHADEVMSRTEALGHRMTGSGSAWFGVFAGQTSARRAARICQSRLPDWFVGCCRGLKRQPPVSYRVGSTQELLRDHH
jgi:4-diphosphocytidyl-2-C-methyl-D-erythritol kinase